MKKIITLTLMLLSVCGFSQNLSETGKLYTTAKLWGFLKYYHPEVAGGKFDWDAQLFDIIEKTKPTSNLDELSAVYDNWLDELGPVEVCKSCSKSSEKQYTDTNFDLSWTQDPKLFSSSISEKLKF